MPKRKFQESEEEKEFEIEEEEEEIEEEEEEKEEEEPEDLEEEFFEDFNEKQKSFSPPTGTIQQYISPITNEEEENEEYSDKPLKIYPGEIDGADYTFFQRTMIEKEDKLRSLFAEDPENSTLSDPYISLINIYDNRSTFKFEELTEDEKAIPKVFVKFLNKYLQIGSSSIVDSLANFKASWKEFTSNMFQGLNFKNVFAAGGSVLACILSDSQAKSKFQGSDIDLFIYGVTEEQANQKVKEIYEVIKKNIPKRESELIVVRSNRAITILGEYPIRHVQIITKLFKSPAEVLLGFDIDICAVGFDGEDVWCAERWRNAVNKRYNLMNKSRRSLTYESRLLKYGKRGFAVAIPGLRKEKVDPNLFENFDVSEIQGLAKLLIYENEVLFGRNRFYVPSRLKKRITTKIARLDQFNESQLQDMISVFYSDPSDYSELYFPWGPKVSSSKAFEILSRQDKNNYFGKINRGKKNESEWTHTHLFVSGIDGILTGQNKHFWCSLCRKTRQDNDRSYTSFLSDKLQWETKRVVYQDIDGDFERMLITGSFSLPTKEWEKDVYSDLSKSTSKPSPSTSKTFRCEICGQVFVSQNQYFKHQRDNSHYNQPGTGLLTQPVPNSYVQPFTPTVFSSSALTEEKIEGFFDEDEEVPEVVRESEDQSLNKGIEFHSLCEISREQWNKMLDSAKCLVILHYLSKKSKLSVAQKLNSKRKILSQDSNLMQSFLQCERLNDLDGLLYSFVH